MHVCERVKCLDNEVSGDDRARLFHVLISQSAVTLGPQDTETFTDTHRRTLVFPTLSVFLSCLTRMARFSFRVLTMSVGLLCDLPNSGMMNTHTNALGPAKHTKGAVSAKLDA